MIRRMEKRGCNCKMKDNSRGIHHHKALGTRRGVSATPFLLDPFNSQRCRMSNQFALTVVERDTFKRIVQVLTGGVTLVGKLGIYDHIAHREGQWNQDKSHGLEVSKNRPNLME